MLYDEKVTNIPRELFVKAVNAEGFPLRTGYVKPIYLEPVYQKKICLVKQVSHLPIIIEIPKSIIIKVYVLLLKIFMIIN